MKNENKATSGRKNLHQSDTLWATSSEVISLGDEAQESGKLDAAARHYQIAYEEDLKTLGSFGYNETVLFHLVVDLMRMRQGDSDRDIAKSGLLGRRTAAALRTLANAQGWLDTAIPLPEDDAGRP